MIVIARKTGRLGNRLKLFAHVIALACEHDLRVANPSFYKYAELFCGTAQSAIRCAFPPQSSPLFVPSTTVRGVAYNLLHVAMSCYCKPNWLREHGPLRLRELELGQFQDISSPDFVRQAKEGLLFLRGYGFRCEHLLTKHRHAVQAFFRPTPPHEAMVDQVMDRVGASENDEVVVGLHVRHGDYAKHYQGRFFYRLDQYHDIMSGIVRCLDGRRVRFLIATDGNLTADDFRPFRVSISGQSPLVDMVALSRCDLLAGPPSSFTEWASFYGDVPLHHIADPNQSIRDDDFVRHPPSMSDLPPVPLAA